jgi:hypothetical protein
MSAGGRRQTASDPVAKTVIADFVAVLTAVSLWPVLIRIVSAGILVAIPVTTLIRALIAKTWALQSVLQSYPTVITSETDTCDQTASRIR